MTGFGFPEILVDIYNRYTAGDIDGATDVRYRPLIRFENQPLINLAICKVIYHWRGALNTTIACAQRRAGRGDADRSLRTSCVAAEAARCRVFNSTAQFLLAERRSRNLI